jgi:hypothetical protein
MVSPSLGGNNLGRIHITCNRSQTPNSGPKRSDKLQEEISKNKYMESLSVFREIKIFQRPHPSLRIPEFSKNTWRIFPELLLLKDVFRCTKYRNL